MKWTVLATLFWTFFSSCTSYRYFNEIAHVGFENDTKKGKSVGSVTGADCVFQILGYWLGGQPTVGRAMSYARIGKRGSIGDAFGSQGITADGIRYLNNVTYTHSGFNAVIVGKNCIEVSGRGFK